MPSQKVTKRKRRNSEIVNRINDLSDDIICHIISFLNIKQAVITGVVSKRWQHLWKHSFKRLDFTINSKETQGLFKKRINHVLDQYLALEVAQINICYWKFESAYDYFKPYSFDGSITRLISFVIEKKVTSLSVIFNNITLPSIHHYQQSSLEHLHLSRCCINGSAFQIFKHLKSLSLFAVELETCDLDNIIFTCSSLENLSLSDVSGLEYVNIVGPSLQLKRFSLSKEIQPPEQIQISAPELIYLQYKGPEISIVLKNCSKLVTLDLKLMKGTSITRMNYIRVFKKILFQIETLSMEIFPHEVEFAQLPTFSNLKTLILVVHSIKVNYIAFSSLLKASPLLRRFELQLRPLSSSVGHPERYNKEIKMDDDNSGWNHSSLEEFHVEGYYGHKYELKLLYYLLKTCISLKQVTLNTRFMKRERKDWISRRDISATQLAKRMHAKHSGVNFVVL